MAGRARGEGEWRPVAGKNALPPIRFLARRTNLLGPWSALVATAALRRTRMVKRFVSFLRFSSCSVPASTCAGGVLGCSEPSQGHGAGFPVAEVEIDHGV